MTEEIIPCMTEEIGMLIEECLEYEISNLGKVRHVKHKRVLKPYTDNHGYMKVSLSRKAAKKIVRHVHRLMALTFLANPENKTQVNHKDGNKSNYNLDNLEWIGISENALHAFEIGKRTAHNKMKISVFKNDIHLGIFDSQAEAARQLGVSSSYFSTMIQKGTIKSKKGFSIEIIKE